MHNCDVPSLSQACTHRATKNTNKQVSKNCSINRLSLFFFLSALTHKLHHTRHTFTNSNNANNYFLTNLSRLNEATKSKKKKKAGF